MSVTVFGSSSSLPGSAEYEFAEQLGYALGKLGLVIITGGYGGLMEAVSKGAHNWTHVIGMTCPILFPDRALVANKYVHEEIQFDSYQARETAMIERGDAYIVLEGQFGTASEFFAVVAQQISAKKPKLVVATTEPWRDLHEITITSTKAARYGSPVFESTIDEIVRNVREALFPGYLELHIGPMYSGKTTSLMEKMEVSRSTIYVRSVVQGEAISHTSHGGKTVPAITTRALADVIGDLYGFQNIFIDESQFYSDLIEFVRKLIRARKNVYVAGLHANILLEKFGSTIDLIPFADRVVWHTAKCAVCGEEAHFTSALDASSKSKIVAGIAHDGTCVGDTLYVATCRNHVHN